MFIGDILPCDDQPQCAYYTGHSSIYETVETQLYVCNKCTANKKISLKRNVSRFIGFKKIWRNK